ncbi:MAG: glycosyltransferase [Candidatus Latescibacterota bacterium]|nr:glycosyltransferase [Candidatus Latescibacterota bacterium]
MIWFITGIRRNGFVVSDHFEVSIVVAARNEADRIDSLLYDLSNQSYTFLEIIVVDDHSTDGTDQVVNDWCQKDCRYKLISLTETEGKKAALTEGISNSNGEIILTTDADCRVGVEWISGMVQYFTPEVGFVVGFSQLKMHRSNLRSSYETIDFLGLMACIWGSCGHGYPMAASGQNMAFRKCVYEEVGGYTGIMHRVSGDDVLFMQKVRASRKWLISFADSEKAYVSHPCSSSWRSLVNQRTRWASNAPLMLRMAPLFFIYLSVAYLINLLAIVLPVLYLFGKFALWPIIVMLFLKLAVEWTIFRRISKIVGRLELNKFWPFWGALQPLCVVLFGFMGSLGVFRWKRRSQRWGRNL